MEFFKSNTKIPFMKQRVAAAFFSGALFLASLIAIAVYGLTFGLDFTGGIQVEVNFPQSVNANQLRDQLQAHGFSEAVVQAYTAKDLSVRLAQPKDMTQDQLKLRLMSAMPGAKISSL
jgi:preprotein translocase subunit SecF